MLKNYLTDCFPLFGSTEFTVGPQSPLPLYSLRAQKSKRQNNISGSQCFGDVVKKKSVKQYLW